jgi:hypothetical protein
MKIALTGIFVLFAVFLFAQAENNDFYDNTSVIKLEGPDLEITGEIENPGKVDFTGLQLRSVIVREAVTKEDQLTFVGSYRYDGYSLFDILKERIINKKNKEEFKPIIDLLVSIENAEGEKVVFSWGEIYYPANLHQIIIATQVAPIIPTKTKEQWPLPNATKVVNALDMATERNISKPTKIHVFSAPLQFPIKDKSKKLIANSVSIFQEGKKISEVRNLSDKLELRTYPSVFYGRGMGFHGVEYFSGKLFKSLLAPFFTCNRMNIQKGYIVVAGADGYRASIAYSELCNRNDQADFLIIDQGTKSDKGRFRLFPTPDFFSDRAVYVLSQIHFLYIKS